MRRIITVQFRDGSGWLFTRAPGDFWYSQTIKAGGFLSPDRGIIPDDVRRRQDGEYMYREGYDVEEERDPVRAECEDCLEITSVPDDWFVNA